MRIILSSPCAKFTALIRFFFLKILLIKKLEIKELSYIGTNLKVYIQRNSRITVNGKIYISNNVELQSRENYHLGMPVQSIFSRILHSRNQDRDRVKIHSMFLFWIMITNMIFRTVYNTAVVYNQTNNNREYVWIVIR